MNFVIVVTHHTSGEAQLLKRGRVRALAEKVSFLAMTLAADARHRFHGGRPRAVVAMTVVAGRCSQVVTLDQRCGVSALPILLELLRVTPGAGRSNLRRIHGRLR